MDAAEKAAHPGDIPRLDEVAPSSHLGPEGNGRVVVGQIDPAHALAPGEPMARGKVA